MTEETVTKLTRCDACGVGVKALITLSNGSKLFFCGHHTREYETALQAKQAVIEWLVTDEK
jgi:hypothetical protein